MAEGVRFELTVVIRHAGFQDRCLKPLGHPSTRENYTINATMSLAMKMKIIKFYEDSIIPEYQTAGAAGFDFCAHISEPYVLKPGEIKAFGTGVGVEIPEGYELQVRSRSGLAYKHQISLLNGIGTIDSDYRGEMSVLLKNHSDQDFVVEPGMRIAQGVVAKYEHVDFEEVSELSESDRAGGFGSTGLK